MNNFKKLKRIKILKIINNLLKILYKNIIIVKVVLKNISQKTTLKIYFSNFIIKTKFCNLKNK